MTKVYCALTDCKFNENATCQAESIELNNYGPGEYGQDDLECDTWQLKQVTK